MVFDNITGIMKNTPGNHRAEGHSAAHNQHEQRKCDGFDLTGENHLIHRSEHPDQPPASRYSAFSIGFCFT
jgi:hypothetical protein